MAYIKDVGSGANLRILCLHGMHQCSETFVRKIAPLASVCREKVQFLPMNAPVPNIPPILRPSTSAASTTATRRPRKRPTNMQISEAQMKELYRSWWTSSKGCMKTDEEVSMERTRVLAYLHEQLRKLEPIDGVLGFSQGAALASWMCSQEGTKELQWTPRFAILIGGYIDSQVFDFKAQEMQTVSSFHTYGVNDRIILPQKSEELVDKFLQSQDGDDQVQKYVHHQGHVIPKDPAFYAQLDDFLDDHIHEDSYLSTY